MVVFQNRMCFSKNDVMKNIQYFTRECKKIKKKFLKSIYESIK